MKIEAGKHPVAIHITDVLVSGVPIQRGTCVWVDLDRGEACVYRTGADGKFLIKNDELVEHVIKGTITLRIPEEHRHLLA
jgi:hypothetical protein